MAEITQVISPFPTAPDSSKDAPSEFNAKADAFVNHQSGVYVAEVNNWATQANTLKGEVNDAKTYIDNVIASLPDGTLDDTVISPTTVWSSKKTNDELSKVIPLSNMTIGNINSPMLDLPLDNSLDMKNGVGQVTFTRATTATHIDRYSVLKHNAVNAPRFEKEGLLIEAESTNLHLHGEMDSGWTVSKATISYNAGVDPSGANKAAKITVSDADIVYAYVPSSAQAGKKYTYSIFVKNISTNGMFRLAFNSSTFGSDKYAYFDLNAGTVDHSSAEDARIQKLGNGWFRVSITDVAITDTTNNSVGLLSLKDTGVIGEEFLIYGGQIEEQPFATSYIPTTDAHATRSNDIVFVLHANMPNVTENDSEISIAFDFTALGKSTSYKYIFCVYDSYSDHIYIRLQPNYTDMLQAVSKAYGGESSFATTGSTAQGDPKKIRVLTIFKDNINIYIDGNNEATDIVHKPISGRPIIGKNIYIGSLSGTSEYTVFGHIKNIRIWERALTEDEARLA